MQIRKSSNDNGVNICWVPSHTRISRNDQADKAASLALYRTTEKKV